MRCSEVMVSTKATVLLAVDASKSQRKSDAFLNYLKKDMNT